jgi:tetratricopeptide (TPR) repeat protein
MSPRSDRVIAGRFCISLLLGALALAPPGRGLAQEPVSAPVAALVAASTGRHAEALALARAMLQVSPDDAFAHYVIGTVMLWQGNAREAMLAGQRAFRAAASKVQKHESARLVATAAVQADKRLAARYWLRHAADTAPDPTRRAAAEAALARLRAATPWSAQLRFGIQPSSNVNAGASSRINVIDGIPITGVLSEDALALPGLVGTLDAQIGLRLAASAQSRTTASLRLFARAVELEGTPYVETTTLAGETLRREISNASLSSGALELGLEHMVATPQLGGSVALALAAGRSWSGGDFGYDYLRLSADRNPQAAGPFYGAAFEQRRAADPRRDQSIASLRGGWRVARGNGDRITLGFGLGHVGSDFANARSTSVSAQISYQPQRQLGPFGYSASFGVSFADYPDYAVGFLAVPGGRQDQLGFAELDLWLPKKSFAGFSPQIRLRAVETRSNVSRFARHELSLSAGFRSNF